MRCWEVLSLHRGGRKRRFAPYLLFHNWKVHVGDLTDWEFANDFCWNDCFNSWFMKSSFNPMNRERRVMPQVQKYFFLQKKGNVENTRDDTGAIHNLYELIWRNKLFLSSNLYVEILYFKDVCNLNSCTYLFIKKKILLSVNIHVPFWIFGWE